MLFVAGTLSCGRSARIEEAVTARGVEADYHPVGITDTFRPDEVLYCAVRVADLPAGATLSARWYHGDLLVEETFYVAEDGGSGWVGFQLTNSAAWPPGRYHVEVYLEDHLWKTVNFSVKPE